MRISKFILWLLPADLLLATFLLYVAGYCTCVRPLELTLWNGQSPARLHVVAYRWESPALAAFFAPANRVDRVMRPAYWRCEATSAPAGLEDALVALAMASNDPSPRPSPARGEGEEE